MRSIAGVGITPPGANFLAAAAGVCGREPSRYSLNRILLRGRTGEIVGTDSKHLLIQGGFKFPWPGDLLIPALPVWDCKDLPTESVEVSYMTRDVMITIGPWSFALNIDTVGRFPPHEQIVPKPSRMVTRWEINPQDAAFLMQTLPRLPGHVEDGAPVTLDLDGRGVVRARGDPGGPVVEAVAEESPVAGPALRLVTERQYLLNALKLGLTDLQFIDANKPLVGRASNKTYLWMPIDANIAIPPTADAIRVPSSATPSTPTAPLDPPSPPRRLTMPQPTTNGSRPHELNGTPDSGPNLDDLLTEAEGLRSVLADANTRLARLAAGLRRQRQQSKTIQAAMASLRKLQQIGP